MRYAAPAIVDSRVFFFKDIEYNYRKTMALCHFIFLSLSSLFHLFSTQRTCGQWLWKAAAAVYLACFGFADENIFRINREHCVLIGMAAVSVFLIQYRAYAFCLLNKNCCWFGFSRERDY